MHRLKLGKRRGVSRLCVAYLAVREAIFLCSYVEKVYKGISLPFPLKGLGI